VPEALQRLEQEMQKARAENHSFLKVIHGYGSTGLGGDIRVAVQKRLREMAESGEIRGCIYGENWSRGDDVTWKLLQQQPELKQDTDLGRGNPGITIILL